MGILTLRQKGFLPEICGSLIKRSELDGKLYGM